MGLGVGDLAGNNTSCQHSVYTLSANVISQNHSFICERPVADISSIHLCNWAMEIVKRLDVFHIKQAQRVPILMTHPHGEKLRSFLWLDTKNILKIVTMLLIM